MRYPRHTRRYGVNGLSWKVGAVALLLVSFVAASPGRANAAAVGTVRLVSHTPAGGYGSGNSVAVDETSDLQHVLFESAAPEMHQDGSNAWPAGVYVADTATGTVQEISTDRGGSPWRISADGNRVLWYDPNGVHLTDRRAGTDVVLPIPDVDFGWIQGADENLDLVLYLGYRNADMRQPQDLFLYDAVSGTTRQLDLDTSGTPISRGVNRGVITADGSTVFYTSFIGNSQQGPTDASTAYRRRLGRSLPDAIATSVNQQEFGHVSRTGDVFELGDYTGSWSVHAPAGTWAIGPSLGLTPDGHYDVFVQDPRTNPQLIRRDTTNGATAVVTQGLDLLPGHTWVLEEGSISNDGETVVFAAATDGVVSGAKPGTYIFRRHMSDVAAERICCGGHYQNWYGPDRLQVDPSGEHVLFQTWEQLSAADQGSNIDIFLWTAPSSMTPHLPLPLAMDSNSQP
jgi:hypothetical protein